MRVISLLSESRVAKLSEITSDLGQIFFASVFLGPFFLAKTNWVVVILGLILSLVSWFASLLLIKN